MKTSLETIDESKRRLLKLASVSPVLLLPGNAEAFGFLLGLAFDLVADIAVSTIFRRSAVSLLSLGATALRSTAVHATERAIVKSAVLSAKGKQRAQTLLHTVDNTMELADFISHLESYDSNLAASYEQHHEQVEAIWSQQKPEINHVKFDLYNKSPVAIHDGLLEITLTDIESGVTEINKKAYISLPANMPKRSFYLNFSRFNSPGAKQASIVIRLLEAELVTQTTVFVV